MLSNEEIGKRIKIEREKRGMTLQDIADKIGVAKSTIQRYEAGTIQNIKLPVVDAIAKSLGINPSWLVGKSDSKDISETINTKDMSFNDREKEVVHKYRSIDNRGKHTVDTVLEMEYNRCNKPHITVNAAHAIDGSSDEDQQHDDNIMREDKF